MTGAGISATILAEDENEVMDGGAIGDKAIEGAAGSIRSLFFIEDKE